MTEAPTVVVGTLANGGGDGSDGAGRLVPNQSDAGLVVSAASRARVAV